MNHLTKDNLISTSRSAGMPEEEIRVIVSRRRSISRILAIPSNRIQNFIIRILAYSLKRQNAPSWHGIILDAQDDESLEILQKGLALIDGYSNKMGKWLNERIDVLGAGRDFTYGKDFYSRMINVGSNDLQNGAAAVACTIARRIMARCLCYGRTPWTAEKEIRVRSAGYRFERRFRNRMRMNNNE